jgi:hypothetical protein
MRRWGILLAVVAVSLIVADIASACGRRGRCGHRRGGWDACCNTSSYTVSHSWNNCCDPCASVSYASANCCGGGTWGGDIGVSSCGAGGCGGAPMDAGQYQQHQQGAGGPTPLEGQPPAAPEASPMNQPPGAPPAPAAPPQPGQTPPGPPQPGQPQPGANPSANINADPGIRQGALTNPATAAQPAQ